MNKLLKNIYIIKFIEYKIISIVCISILLFINYNEFLTQIKYSANIYDFIIYIFNNKFFSLYTIPFLFLFNLYIINYKNRFLNIFSRFSNKNDLIHYEIKLISKLLIIFIFTIIIISILITSTTLSILPTWSEQSLYTFEFIPRVLKYNPLCIIFIQLLLFYLYVFTLSIMFIIASNFFKSNLKSILIILIINSVNIGILSSNNKFIAKYSLACNMMFNMHNLGKIDYYPTVLYSILYFIIIIISIKILGTKLINKIDLC